MKRALHLMVVALTVAVTSGAIDSPKPQSILHLRRSAPGDLEVGGELAGQPTGSTRYIRYEDLLSLPQETYTVSDDSNLPKKTEISGVPLATLAHLIGQPTQDALIVAICYDKYRTNYPTDYLIAHHPLLVLRINGKSRDQWPPSEYGGPMGPYLISHPFFKPSFKVLSHEDEPQIPFGVTRIEVHKERTVLGVILPPGKWPADSLVEQGHIIAQQDCFRCHNMGAQGGTMANAPWLKLAVVANEDPRRFRNIIHDPKSVFANAKMPAHSDYDDATLDALTAYFKTFAPAKIPSSARNNQ